MKYSKDSQRGMALLMALFFISIALILLSGMAVRLISQRAQVGHYEQHKMAFLGLEAAYASALFEIEAGEDGMIGLGDYSPPQGSKELPSFETSGITPLKLTSMDGVEYMGMAHNWMGDGVDNNGDGTVDFPDEQWMYSVHAWARAGEHVRQMEAVVRGGDVNVWRNAIFAGNGQIGGCINGNVSIHGSVHILGNNIIQGGTVLAAIDLSGTSLIHNNYEGCPAALLARVPPLQKGDWNGEQVETLNANLRVKHGLVGMSGNSEVGSADTTGDSFKETMDGTYVNDGWTGTAVVDDGDRGDPKTVWSDNGWDELYDCGDKVPFPMLSDDWRAPATGAKEWNGATSDWYSHQDYFDQVLVAQPNNPNDGVYVGDIDIYTMGSHFYWNATTGQKLVGSLPATPPAATDDYILYNVDTDVLKVNGQITVQGNVAIRGKGNQTTVNYSGRGAMLVHGNVAIDSNLLTCNNGNPASTANSFPVNNCLGIMAENSMVVGSTAQVSIMGAFYAQNQILSSKQTNVMGTFVSSYFNMGTNVPSIFQVPALADNLPLGMIGNYPILAFQRESWREIGVQL